MAQSELREMVPHLYVDNLQSLALPDKLPAMVKSSQSCTGESHPKAEFLQMQSKSQQQHLACLIRRTQTSGHRLGVEAQASALPGSKWIHELLSLASVSHQEEAEFSPDSSSQSVTLRLSNATTSSTFS